MTKVVVYSSGASGHHPEYDAVLGRELSALGVDVVFTNRLAVALAADRVLFAMIDGNWRVFLPCALLSCVLTRRRVAGLFFRVGECFRPGLKYRLKRFAFHGLRAAPRTRVLSIGPFSVAPHYAEVAWEWAPDPQLWDRQVFAHLRDRRSTPLSDEIVARAGGRPIVIALGEQNVSKGFTCFCDVWGSAPELRERRLLVAAGRVAPQVRDEAEGMRQAGGVVIDRYLSAEELSSLYNVADFIWAAYHPNYDQASGIIGRAFQFGVPVVLRRGSLMAALMRELGHATVEIDFDDPVEAARRVLARAATPHTPSAEAGAALRSRFIETVVRSLDIDIGASSIRARRDEMRRQAIAGRGS